MIPSNSIAEARRADIVGPGLMGLGVAQALACAGVEVALCGRDAEAAKVGREKLAASLRRQVAKGRLDAGTQARILSRVCAATLTRDGLAGCQIVIESVPEDRALKREVLAAAQAAAPDAMLATNTSGLAISGLAGALRDPARFLGLHFFSPAERMPLVEVVKGRETAEAVVRSALAFLDSVGKRPVIVRDGPGFFATRVFAAYLDEAVAMLAEGVAPALIEQAALANGRALGPLATLDETGIGLNALQALQARADGLEARFCRPLAASAFTFLVEAGRGGRRAGGGFFDWPAEGARAPWPGLEAHFPRARQQPEPADVALRLLVAEAREALLCLEEGVIASADDADAASVLGLGFPSRLGGIVCWAENLGLGAFVAACDRLAAAHGERFAATPWLRELGVRGHGLKAYRRQEGVA